MKTVNFDAIFKPRNGESENGNGNGMGNGERGTGNGERGIFRTKGQCLLSWTNVSFINH